MVSLSLNRVVAVSEKTQKTLLVKFNQTRFEGGVTNLEKNEVAIIILIRVCTDKTT